MGKKKKQDVSVKELLTRGILHYLKAHPNKEFNYKQLASALLVKDEHTRKLIVKILENLVSTGFVHNPQRGKYLYKEQGEDLTGTIDITRSGAGYFIPEGGEGDYYVQPEHLGKALHGDKVRVKLVPAKRGRKFEAKIIEVLERARKLYAGTADIQKSAGFFIPGNPKIHVDFFIPKQDLLGAQNGQKVVAELVSWEKGEKSPTGRIVKVLGFPGDNDAEIHSILAEFELPYEFPAFVEEAAASLPTEITEEEVSRRKDFREVTTFTIDPADAKDFDDALSFRKLENGNVEIGIHIADVSHYVTPGSILDREALNRATSIYLVDRVVPMLPEVLSNGLCSLRPNEDKLCFSAVFEMTSKARVVSQWFGRTIIHSDRRFTYEEAQSIIETGEGDFNEEILALDKLAKILRKERIKHGAIEFGSDEIKFRLNEKGKPVAVYKKVMKDSNKLIEEFMLLANKRVSELFGKSVPPKPFAYRIHDEPDPDKLKVLKNYLKEFGYKLQHVEGKTAAYALNQVLHSAEGKPEEGIIKQLAIRSMAKAVYSTENIGHYGLAFEYYSHFTSPIRRYPDIMVHRLLQQYLDKTIEKDIKKLEMQCRQSSAMERKAVEAERASIKYMQVQFMMDKIGEEFDGIISGLSGWGIYVEIIENGCEGMVSLSSLKDDKYVFEENKYKIVGERWGREFHLGNPMRIKVRSADLLKKQLDFEFVDPFSE